MKSKVLLIGIVLSLMHITTAIAGDKLTGTIIGSAPHNYNGAISGGASGDQLADYAFDGDFNTFYASAERSLTYVGLDLGEPYIIDRVGWSPRNDDGVGAERVLLGVFQGANSPDFMDAVSLYIIKEKGEYEKVSYADIDCSRGFRYVRYVGPNDTRCNIAEVEFYGTKGVGDDTKFPQLTNLPTVSINTVDAVEPYDKVNNIVSRIIIVSDSGQTILDAPGETRLRGNASTQFPKKPYRIKFDKKQRVLNAPANAKKWTLINNYGDKTLMRNILAFEISRRFEMDYTPFCQPVDVVLNGEYKGTYQLCDQVEVGDDRIEIDEITPQDTTGIELTGGYHIEIDGYASQEISWFQTTYGIPVTIKYPDEEEITPQQYDYISGQFNSLENVILLTYFMHPVRGYRNRLDMPSFLDYMSIQELAGNPDMFWSVHLKKYRDDPKFYIASIWDFDIAFDNDNRNVSLFEFTDFLYKKTGTTNYCTHLLNRIFDNDSTSMPEWSQRWSDARHNKGINVESLLAYIDSTEAVLQQSQALNFMRWDILNTMVHQNPRALGSYEAEVEWLRKYIAHRIPFLDNLIGLTETSGYSDIAETSISAYPENGGITISGADDNAEVVVYNINGRLLYRGTENFIPINDKGCYIVKVGDKVLKVLL